MLDIVPEVARSLVMLVIFGFLLVTGRKHEIYKQREWHFIVTGFGLLLLGSLLDITDNFESLNRYVVIGDTPAEAVLEKVVGYLLGFALLFAGFWYWLPLVGALRAAERRLETYSEDLKTKVAERTVELESANEELQAGIIERKRAMRASPARFSDSTGLRLWGMAEDPFWPGAKYSSASLSSVRRACAPGH